MNDKVDNKDSELLVVILQEEKGTIVLSQEEKELLSMQLGFQLQNDLDDEEMELELAAMGTTFCWEIHKEERESIKDEMVNNK